MLEFHTATGLFGPRWNFRENEAMQELSATNNAAIKHFVTTSVHDRWNAQPIS